ncbi:sugar 3,4-ketoisomerase [Aegicerativicinus sediminis]|uniref:sugar 3,4-ketoisomerase n=1 Tax=Aegicerativicinus sediminis TaxID=2893202 RepID=UPI001E53F94F|nr:FdtA/QdtA family cupin domain-containing protein [Aegicerativicinus sediminis]
MTTINDIKQILIPDVHSERGKLAVIEKNIIPFEIKRVYYLYDVPHDSYRGGHAHKEQKSLVIALSGSFDILVDDSAFKKTITLNKPNQGLFIPTGVWREILNFSSGAVCLVLASNEFNEDEYIREYDDFLLFKGA